ncbi:MAG: tRNA pseudouridine(38-40) synthase TruA [Micavibrio sp.]|nr:tRNA pseudouridine(38-40) synthase TruA [Micavibrio sp.]
MKHQRYKITIEYDGGAFYGWQRQPDVPSVQQYIEEAITKFCQQNISITVAGRTDAGVHAAEQIAHFDLVPLKRNLSGFEICKALNAHLIPHAISILNCEKVSDDFHARFAAKNKLYRYRLVNRQAPLTRDVGRAWHVKQKLDVEAMRAAAKHLIGQHDFTTFRDSDCQAKSPVRTLDRLDIISQGYDAYGGKEIICEAEGMSFLHHMVRNIVGTLVWVGKDKWPPEYVRTALETRDRTKGGPTAPAQGLALIRVDYGIKTL